MPALIKPLAAACLMAATAAAWADAPLVSETADVIPDRACQVEVAAARAPADSRRSAARTCSAPAA